MSDRALFRQRLQAALADWAAPSVEDHLNKTRMLELLGASPAGASVFERSHYAPGHFTASAFVLSPDEGSLLLIRHRKLGLWLQPGGHLEPTDEDWIAAALRELVEETGVEDFDVVTELFDLDVHEIPAFASAPAHLHHDVRVLLRARGWLFAASEEVADAAWFPLEVLLTTSGDLRDGAPTDESVRKVARRIAQDRPAGASRRLQTALRS